MHIENLNSTVTVDIVRGKRKSSRASHALTISEDAILAQLGILNPYAFGIPIYLVDETYLAPREAPLGRVPAQSLRA